VAAAVVTAVAESIGDVVWMDCHSGDQGGVQLLILALSENVCGVCERWEGSH